MASQPTLSRFDNMADKTMIFDFCYTWIDQYVASLEEREEVVKDIDPRMPLPTDPSGDHVQRFLRTVYVGTFINGITI